MLRFIRAAQTPSSHAAVFEHPPLMPLSTGSRRSLSVSLPSSQARQRVRPVPIEPPPRRPCFGEDSPFLPVSSLVGTQWRAPVAAEESWRYPVAIPNTAVDKVLLRKVKRSESENQLLDSVTAVEIRQAGEGQVKKIADHWVRNELNVMGTIREETIEIFLKLLLHPSTLAPLADRLKLRTAGRQTPVKASLHPPARLVPASTHADIELTQLFYYLIGSIYRSLPSADADSSPSDRLRKYVINLLMNGLPHTSASKLLIRASQLSGQAAIGVKKGHARAEIRVAQLSIWGERRSKKLRKLVPDQKCHRTPLRMRKAVLLKQRWRDEEEKMIHWRNRLLNVTAHQEADALADKLRREEHALQIKKWRETQLGAGKPLKPEAGLFARLLGFWKSPATS